MTGAGLYSRSELRRLPAPEEAWLTPLWFRLFAAVLGVVASLCVAYALTSLALAATTGDALRQDLKLILGGAVALLLSLLAWRFFNPLDWRKWFRFALAPDGIYLPGRSSGLVLVPWTSVAEVDVERWYFKGDHSAARLLLDLDDDVWECFEPGARIIGEGRRRRVTLAGLGGRGEAIAERIETYRSSRDALRD